MSQFYLISSHLALGVMLELPLLALAFAKNPLVVCLGGEELPDTHAESIGKNITEGWKGERVRRSRVKHLLAMCVVIMDVSYFLT